jgi:F-type H+-transporting ATPase subunit delta
MAEAITIARPYAEAAFKLAVQKNGLAAWADMLRLLEAIAQDTRMRACIGDPNVSAAQLDNLFLAVCGDKLDTDGRNFVKVLAQNARAELLPHIRELFDALKAEHEGTLKARIVSAFPMSDAQLSQLAARLEQKYGRKINATVEVDNALIGGLRIEVGDQVMDASVRGRLEGMAQALTR